MKDPLIRNENNEDSDYIGNMWGWKMSWYGLAVVIIFGTIFFVRQCTHPEVDMFEQEDTHWESPSIQ